MCCGQKRDALRNSAGTGTVPKTSAPGILYYLRNVPMKLRGAISGRPHDFPPALPPNRPSRGR